MSLPRFDLSLVVRGQGSDILTVCVCVGCSFLRTPSRAPYRTPSACANRAAYPDPPVAVVSHRPGSLTATLFIHTLANNRRWRSCLRFCAIVVVHVRLCSFEAIC